MCNMNIRFDLIVTAILTSKTFSEVELAEKVGVSQSTINRIKNRDCKDPRGSVAITLFLLYMDYQLLPSNSWVCTRSDNDHSFDVASIADQPKNASLLERGTI